MSAPARLRPDLLTIELPRAVWSRSGRPLQGRLVRTFFAFTLILLGMAMPWPLVSYGLLVAGVAGFVLLPRLTDRVLERYEAPIVRATKDDAPRLQDQLAGRVLVKAFAPDAWVTLQTGRLAWAMGDGRAAAQAFADTARIIREPKRPELLSAQAHALMLAGDRAQAKPLLVELEERDALSPRDRLDLGVISLGEAARADKARALLGSAHGGLDGHPHAAAALAVALARADELERATELVEQAEAEIADDDVLGQELLKRARKALRTARKKKRKG